MKELPHTFEELKKIFPGLTPSVNNEDDTNISNNKASDERQTDHSSTVNALQLYNKNITEIPRLLEPFLQKVGLAALVGTSDSGKSTFLRQLCLSIILKNNDFLDFKLNSEHFKAIYVSTEDDANAISYSIRKQIQSFRPSKGALNLLENLEFIFDIDKLVQVLDKKLNTNPVDLIVVDAFADVFTKELNSNTQVRQFLNEYDKLAKKHNCLILFLHHIGKNTQKLNPSKDSIIGSQAFESKMRVVLELRPNRQNQSKKDLWVLKANFLDSTFKNNSFELSMNNKLTFTNTGLRSNLHSSKRNNPEIINKVLEYKKNGLSLRETEAKLKGTKHEIKKSTINEILKDASKEKPSK